MAKFLCIAAAAVCFMMNPHEAYATEVDVRFNINEEQWITEVWYNHSLFWQVAVCCDGVVPALAGREAKYRTLIVPEFENGLFLLRVK